MRGRLAVVALVALVHALLYVVHQRPDWPDANVWSDQVVYEALGENLAFRGLFTREPAGAPPVPEYARTPGYPALLALVYRAFGVSRLAVALVQAVLFAVLALVAAQIAAALASPRVGFAAGLATALYAPLPYYGALALTDFLTAFVFTAAIAVTVRAIRTGSPATFAVAGALLGYLALTRPAWALFAPCAAGALWLVALTARRALRPRQLAPLVVVSVVLLGGWLAYGYVNFDRVGMVQVGFWRSAWWGYWHGVWSGAAAQDLIAVNASGATGAELEERLRRFGDGAALMRRYIEEDRRILKARYTATDPWARATADIETEKLYRAQVLENIRHDAAGYLVRKATYGMFVLWAAELPIRYSLINATPRLVIRAIWLAQVALLGLALVGLVLLARRDRVVATLFATSFVYVVVVHFFLHSDPRYSLPVKPLVVILAVLAVAEAGSRMWPPAARVRA